MIDINAKTYISESGDRITLDQDGYGSQAFTARELEQELAITKDFVRALALQEAFDLLTNRFGAKDCDAAPLCSCLETLGDNPQCALHGDIL